MAVQRDILYRLKEQLDLAESSHEVPQTEDGWWNFFSSIQKEVTLFRVNNEWVRGKEQFNSLEDMLLSFATQIIQSEPKPSYSCEWILFWKEILANYTDIRFDDDPWTEATKNPRVYLYSAWFNKSNHESNA